MKNLFDPTLAEEIKRRIMRLNSGSERLWGTMTVAQTMAHCTFGIQMATGVINPRRASFPANVINPRRASFPANVIGLVIKPLIFGDDKPMRRNSPSSPELFSADPARCDFENERIQLMATIDSFVAQGAAGSSRHPHPFFGPLKPQQWAILMYKHLDHHLRQFGV